MTDDPSPTPPLKRYRRLLWRFRRHPTLRPKLPAWALAPDVDPLQDPYYEPSAADFLPSPPPPPSPLARWPAPSRARPALIGFALFWTVSLADWRGGFNLSVSGDAVFARHEVWRLITALFAHSSPGHLLANSPLFLIFGWFLADHFGYAVFPCGALAIGMLSNLATIAFYDPRAELLGASGMLYGMVALWLLCYVRFETNLRFGKKLLRATGTSLVLLFPTTFEPRTSYLAHGFGFGFGLLVGALLLPFLRRRMRFPGPEA